MSSPPRDCSPHDFFRRAVRPDADRRRHDRRALCADGARHHLHLQHRQDDQLVDGRVLHDRQLSPVSAGRRMARTGSVVGGGAAVRARRVRARLLARAAADQTDVHPRHRAQGRLRHRRHHRALAAVAQSGDRAQRPLPAHARLQPADGHAGSAARKRRASRRLCVCARGNGPVLSVAQTHLARAGAAGRGAEPGRRPDRRRRRVPARPGGVWNRRRTCRDRGRAARRYSWCFRPMAWSPPSRASRSS